MRNDPARILNLYRAQIDRYLARLIPHETPVTLYEPSRYILGGGGKRIRPLLTILACGTVGGDPRCAVHAGAAMEILHNFTLVHDDIMDHAASRRGRLTVHVKWDPNIAILAGDVLTGLAYRTLLRTEGPHLAAIVDSFTEALVEVCEGQAYDKEFETDRSVTIEDYMMMIRKKTGTLIAASAEIGALAGGASPKAAKALWRFGALLGQAFQLQDDLLDITGDARTFGKTIGGDILEGKKTFLLLYALQHSTGADRRNLMRVFRHEPIRRGEIPAFRRIFERTGAVAAAVEICAADIAAAHRILRTFPPGPARAALAHLADELMHRKS